LSILSILSIAPAASPKPIDINHRLDIRACLRYNLSL